MNRKVWLALMLAVAANQGCGVSTASHQDHQTVAVRLKATPQNTGEIAQATLVAEGSTTGITFFIGGVPSGVSRPVHLYTFIYPGSCGKLGTQPAYAMNQTVETYRFGPAQGGWRMSKSLPVPLDRLRSGGYSIVVQTSPADGHLDIFCGDIKQG